MVVLEVIGIILNKPIHILDQIFYLSMVCKIVFLCNIRFILICLGTVRTDDNLKNSTPRFGYSPQNRLQPVPSSSFHQDQSSNLVTKSLDNMTWSATDQLNCRPSLSQYSNRYERHAKDGFTYWPTDLAYKKPRCMYCTIKTMLT